VLLNLTAKPAAEVALEVEKAAKSGDEVAARTAFSRARPLLDEVAVQLVTASLHAGAVS
jgi:hypothetical protein